MAQGARVPPFGNSGSEDGIEFNRRDIGAPAGVDTHPRPAKPGLEFHIEKSPMHNQPRTPGRGSSSPMTERRATRDLIHGTPGRSHLASTSQGDDHDGGVIVPRFGEWDDNDPRSGEGFTEVFNNVRRERQGIESSGTNPHANTSHSGAARKAKASGSKGACCGCCPWLGI
ncbi:hypothetical protein MLD38_012407 [Melastoma candidum]|uniref:Uncharacterized protein n=1 Tax=Melastoma candidum TaxID=119954 RepID=A0ACB9R9A8_9MYRT|nr:hypothetical protein MLD38_012407 [Melastoma candidum]